MNILELLSQLAAEFQTWFLDKIIVVDGSYQIIIIAILFILAYVIAQGIKRTIYPKISDQDSFLYYLRKLIIPIIFLSFMMITKYIIYHNFHWINPLVDIITNLFMAFIIIKLLAYIFKEAIWFNIFKTILWILVALNIFHLFDDFTNFLDNIRFSYADNELSVLLIIKGILILFFSLWFALKLSEFIQAKIAHSQKINPSLQVLFSKITKIILLFLAALIGLNIIGIKLTTFAVLGGAVGVGIGFGLQKIVSNYISGFILLLDKSIKPGDIIEIDQTFGSIKSMSTRYVTVSTIGGKEHLIPNEDLITHKVINWSHTNTLIRLKITVGVSYSTDIPKAMKIVKETAQSHPRVEQKSNVAVFLDEFNSSSIDLELRFWIKDPDKGVANIKSDIRLEIWKKFREHNIEIPFPQNDVYIKSMPDTN